MKRGSNSAVLEVQRWFRESVTYEGEPYVIDYEQAAAVADESLNTIVVARAGSGKTRTLVAKIVYLVTRCGVEPGEIMAFVFNANAAKEINERLSKMRVDGESVINGVEIANTFHAFARKIVYKVCKGEKKCGKILAGEKEAYVLEIVKRIMREKKWVQKVVMFMRGSYVMEVAEGREEGTNDGAVLGKEEIERFATMMAQFINRAQQKYLGGEVTLSNVAKNYLAQREVHTVKGDTCEVLEREKLFIELGVEVFRRYHWYLLDAKRGLVGFTEYGTDFNLIVSWASKLIASKRKEVVELLVSKEYLLIDEYQDFSQLFLGAVQTIRGVAKEARLFVVGDDWQAINRFAGSDVEYFRNFEGYFNEGFSRYEITTNYRCDRAVVEAARKFMRKSMKEKGNFKAFSRKYGKVVVVNPRETEVRYALVPYDTRVSEEDRIIREAAHRTGCKVVKKSVVRYLKAIMDLIRTNREAREILILHRNNEMNLGSISLEGLGEGLKWGLGKLGVMNADDFNGKVKLMTMHKSKGLEAEVVIILEADEGVIPKMHPDTLLYGLFGETNEVALDDQKRLFYVAMTRAKHRLYIISEGGGFMKYLGRGVESFDFI